MIADKQQSLAGNNLLHYNLAIETIKQYSPPHAQGDWETKPKSAGKGGEKQKHEKYTERCVSLLKVSTKTVCDGSMSDFIVFIFGNPHFLKDT